MAEAATAGKKEPTFFEQGLAAECAGKVREAAALYRRGWEEAHDGNAGAQWCSCLSVGLGVAREVRAAVRVAQELVAADCPLGEYFLGEAARTGKGAPMDEARSRACFRRLMEATEQPREGLNESLRCLYRATALLQQQDQVTEEGLQLMNRMAELQELPNACCLSVLYGAEPPTAARTAEIRDLLHRAAERQEPLLPLAEALDAMRSATDSAPAGEMLAMAQRVAACAAGEEAVALPVWVLLFRLWGVVWQNADEISPVQQSEAEARGAEAMARLLQGMRLGLSGIEPEPPRGLDAFLIWPFGSLMSYAWVYQPDALQDMALAEQGYRSDVAAYLRLTNETSETLSRFRIRVCDIANGTELETVADDVELAPGGVADISLCMRGLTYSESMYVEVSSGPYHAELDAEDIDLQALLDYPAPTPADVCWETGFWGLPVLRVFNPGTEPLRVSLSSEGGVPCWCPKTVPPQEEVRFGWYDMMHLRMPAAGECAILHTAGYGDMSLRITASDRDDNIPGWRDWLDWLLG